MGLTEKFYEEKRFEIETKIDNLIDDSINNFTIKLKEQLDNDNYEEIMKIIKEDLETKRINIKEHFINILNTTHKKAINNAVRIFEGELDLSLKNLNYIS